MYRILSSFLLFMSLFVIGHAAAKPRVFVFTDINIDAGDPDDRQSLVHLLWYADELQIEGVVPDRWDAQGFEACQLVVDAYFKDFSALSLKEKGFPSPESLRNRIAKDRDDAARMFSLASSDTSGPLYVLVWGNMELFRSILSEHPGYAPNIRLITIGTGLMAEADMVHIPAGWSKSEPCRQLNWNGAGRNMIYENPGFHDMWWVEMNWTYAGMFSGEEPALMFEKLSHFGHMGRHIKEVVKNESWAQYFRVGDTPSVLYLIDPRHNPDNPTQGSWAGRFIRPFPEQRPHYYTDDCGSVEWNYADPCSTWQNHQEVQKAAIKTLEDHRSDMYAALIRKLEWVYGVD